MIEMLQYPFMQRAIIGGAILAILLSFLGVFVVLRRMAFFGDGIAHASLGGIAIGLFTLHDPLIVAVIFSLILAMIIFYLERKTTLSSDVIIGLLFTTSMALGIILISLKSGYQPELVSFLFGNILAIKRIELIVMSVFALLTLFFLFTFYKQITFITFDEEGAKVAGIRVNVLDFVFYLALAIAVVLGVRILGIILVSALLIIPPAIAKLIAPSFKSLIVESIIFAELITLSGLFVSYFFNLPTGATIILLGAILFFLTFFIRKFLHH
jgi:zinc transport system permease protein